MDDADCAVMVIGPKQPYLDWIRSVENPLRGGVKYSV